MEDNLKRLDYRYISRFGTGGHPGFQEYKVVQYPVGKYIAKVVLGPSNQFIGIVEIGVNKNFMSHLEKLSKSGFHDVEDYYRE